MRFSAKRFCMIAASALWCVVMNGNLLPAAEIVAHRGASFEAPENTLASVKLGWEKNADAVEVDVYLSKDNQIVCIHDKTTKRTAGGKEVKVVDLTLEELKKLDAGSWKSPKYKGEPIPTLLEVLDTIPAGKRLFIEIKCGPEIVPFLKEDLRKAGKPAAETCVISFSEAACEVTKREIPELKVYWLSGQKLNEETKVWEPSLDALIATAKRLNSDGLDLKARENMDAEFVNRIKSEGLGIYVYTVNDPSFAKKLEEAGIEGITTDRPAYLRKALER